EGMMNKIGLALVLLQTAAFACPDFSGKWKMRCEAPGSTPLESEITVSQKECGEIRINNEDLGIAEPAVQVMETSASGYKAVLFKVYSAHWQEATLAFHYKLVEKVVGGPSREKSAGGGEI